jgi:hypothetical protein
LFQKFLVELNHLNSVSPADLHGSGIMVQLGRGSVMTHVPPKFRDVETLQDKTKTPVSRDETFLKYDLETRDRQGGLETTSVHGKTETIRPCRETRPRCSKTLRIARPSRD